MSTQLKQSDVWDVYYFKDFKLNGQDITLVYNDSLSPMCKWMFTTPTKGEGKLGAGRAKTLIIILKPRGCYV